MHGSTDSKALRDLILQNDNKVEPCIFGTTIYSIGRLWLSSIIESSYISMLRCRFECPFLVKIVT